MTAIRPERHGADRIAEKFGAGKPVAERNGSDKSGPEKFAPDRRAPERPSPDRSSPERLGDIDRVAAFEGEIREFVRRDVAPTHRSRSEADTAGDPVADNLNALIRRVSGASMEEIDRVILELQSVRDMLRNEGDRVSREVAGYASLSHAAMTAMSVIADSLTQWKSAPGQQGPRPDGERPQGQRSAG